MTCTLSKVDVTCNGGTDGSLTVTGMGGTAAYEYSLNGSAFQPGNVFTGLTQGSYTVTIRDANDCTSTCTETIAEPSLLTCTTSQTDATDCAVDDGTITVTGAGGTPGAGGYEYSLNNGTYQTSNSFIDLPSGSYTIRVKDENGCTSECTAMIAAPSAPACMITASTDVTCNGLSTGSLTVSGSGGSGSYDFSLNNGTFATATGLSLIHI